MFSLKDIGQGICDKECWVFSWCYDVPGTFRPTFLHEFHRLHIFNSARCAFISVNEKYVFDIPVSLYIYGCKIMWRLFSRTLSTCGTLLPLPCIPYLGCIVETVIHDTNGK